MTAEPETRTHTIILASRSSGRMALMETAGLPFDAVAADIDEQGLQARMSAKAGGHDAVAVMLAEAKAAKISSLYPGALVVGSDQLLITPDGTILHKPDTPADAEAQLEQLAGREHRLISAIVVYQNTEKLWQTSDMAELTMHGLTADYISNYVATHWEDIRHCVGCYRIEAEGRSLFERIEGDESTIMGMPMPPLLDYLRSRGYQPAS